MEHLWSDDMSKSKEITTTVNIENILRYLTLHGSLKHPEITLNHRFFAIIKHNPTKYWHH